MSTNSRRKTGRAAACAATLAALSAVFAVPIGYEVLRYAAARARIRAERVGR